MDSQKPRIGFVGTRFATTDGVSLESAKWAKVLADHGCSSFWLAGESDRAPEDSMLEPLASFQHPEISAINEAVFGKRTRSPSVTAQMYQLAESLKEVIYNFVQKFDIELLIAQNALTIPMNIPLGLALTTYVNETAMPLIAHHHDFYWERDRFTINAVSDVLNTAFPPSHPSIAHATINSFGQEALSHRRGVSSVLVPNVLNFEEEPPSADEYASNFRRDVQLSEDDIVFLQPTRVVPRKGIEHSIALVSALDNPRAKLIVSHQSGDEGHDYQVALQEMARSAGITLQFVDEFVGEQRKQLPDGKRIYTLADVYSQADFITYPSIYEGFGNALLEAFYFRKPVLVNRYSIFISDIEPKGFRVITMNGYLTNEVVSMVKQVIQDQAFREEIVNLNYELAKKFFGFSVLRTKLRSLVNNFLGSDVLC